MDEEKEDSNENETFSRRHCCSSQEVQETPEIGVWLATQEM